MKRHTMNKILIKLIPAVLALVVVDASARYLPYQHRAVQKITPAQYDQNGDSYITADEVEVELREDAIDKVIAMQKQGKSKQEIARVIMDMEDSIEFDAETIINILDTDGDELVEPEELKNRMKKRLQKQAKIAIADYDQNGDSYITADEVEVELREFAINKVIEMQKRGLSQKAIDRVIMRMEKNIEQDAEAIIDRLDTDGDELVEPEERRGRICR